jgi:hypothetical protein
LNLFTFERSPWVWLFLCLQLLFWMSAVSLTCETSKIYPAQVQVRFDLQNTCSWISYSILRF